MPSHIHEVLLEIFRDRPAFVAELLTGPLGIPVPQFHSARLSPGDLTDVAPTEYRADAVITLDGADGPVLAVVVEVQLRVDPRKRYAWPAYVATLYARLKCPVVLLVLCPDPAVASWCAEPIVVSDSVLTLKPAVLGPRQVPLVTDISTARRHPELTVFSALAHGGDRNTAVFTALFAALDVVDLDRANLYIDLVLMVLPAAARVWLEELMTTAPHQYRSDFARRYYGQGKAEGKAEGEAVGGARSLLAILDARGITISDDVRARITACTDVDKLDVWIRRAATAENIQGVLD